MLILPVAVYAEIRLHAVEAYPHECCGFLIGLARDPRTVRRSRRLVNLIAEGARDRYEIDPLDWSRVERTLSRQEQVIGVYHSHPDYSSRPSAFDEACAHPGVLYLIVAVRSGEVVSTQAWELPAQALGLSAGSRVFREVMILEGVP